MRTALHPNDLADSLFLAIEQKSASYVAQMVTGGANLSKRKEHKKEGKADAQLTPIEYAVETGWWAGVQEIAEKAYKRAAIDRYSTVPDNANFGNALLLSLCAGQFDIARLLLQITIDVRWRFDDTGNGLLHTAVENEAPPDVIGLLMQRGANLSLKNKYKKQPEDAEEIQQTPIEYAAELGWWDSVQVIVEQTYKLANEGKLTLNKSANFGRALLLSLQAGQFDIARLLLQNTIDVSCYFPDTGNGVLHTAIENGASPDVIDLLIQRGANLSAINKKHQTPIFIAIQQENLSYVGQIVAAGASLAARTEYKKDDKTEAKQLTPIEYAVKKGWWAGVRVIVEKAYERWEKDRYLSVPKSANFGNALLRSLRVGQFNIACLLLKNTIDVNWRFDDTGNGVLHTAVKHGAPDDVIGLLIQRGANLSLKNKYKKQSEDSEEIQQTPIEYAAAQGWWDGVRAISAHAGESVHHHANFEEALLMSLDAERFDIAQLLLQRPISITKGALDVAVKKGAPVDVISLLVKRGNANRIDRSIQTEPNQEGLTPLTMAVNLDRVLAFACMMHPEVSVHRPFREFMMLWALNRGPLSWLPRDILFLMATFVGYVGHDFGYLTELLDSVQSDIGLAKKSIIEGEKVTSMSVPHHYFVKGNLTVEEKRQREEIAEGKAAEAKRAEEERKAAEEERAAEARRVAEERRAAAEKRAAEAKKAAEERRAATIEKGIELFKGNIASCKTDQEKSPYVDQFVNEFLDKDYDTQESVEAALIILDQMEGLYPKTTNMLSSLFYSIASKSGERIQSRNALIIKLADRLINKECQSPIAYYLRGMLEPDGSQYLKSAREINTQRGGKVLTKSQLERLGEKYKNDMRNKKTNSFVLRIS